MEWAKAGRLERGSLGRDRTGCADRDLAFGRLGSGSTVYMHGWDGRRSHAPDGEALAGPSRDGGPGRV